jgi:hypothetical protein
MFRLLKIAFLVIFLFPCFIAVAESGCPCEEECGHFFCRCPCGNEYDPSMFDAPVFY